MAVRISGINLPNDKRVEIGLTYILGIGRSLSGKILQQVEVDPNIRIKDLTEEQTNKLREAVEGSGWMIEGDLRREVLGNIKRLQEIKSYRGSRHSKNLPARGQRTKTNNRTVRGNVRKTMGSGRKQADQKT